MFDEDGAFLGYRGSGRDITAQVIANKALRDSEERHRRFAPDVAHELRPPLAVLRSNLDNLENRQTANSLRHDVDAVTRLVEQLLVVARLEFLEVQPGDRADVRRICTRVAEHLAPLAVKEDRSIEVTGDPGAIMLRANGDALEQAVRDLVENAIRYSDPGTTVSIDVATDGTVRIKDRGKGIPRHIRDSIFQRFHHADQGRGGGLGLAIVKRTVEAHQGSIEIDDNDGGDAVFTMRFPPDRVLSANQ
jgi:signal transduction histidine kinase